MRQDSHHRTPLHLHSSLAIRCHIQLILTEGRQDLHLVVLIVERELGHIRKYCPYEQRVNAGGWSNNPTPAAARGVSERCGSSPVYIRTRIGNRFYRCLLDSGCDMTLLPSNLVKKDQIYSTTQSCLAANGTKIPVLGWSSIELRLAVYPSRLAVLSLNTS